MYYEVNNIYIRADSSLFLEIVVNGGDNFFEAIVSKNQVAAIYKLASKKCFTESEVVNFLDKKLFHSFLDTGFIVPFGAVLKTEGNEAFRVGPSGSMVNEKCRIIKRVVDIQGDFSISIVDNLFSNEIDFDVSKWAGSLPYRLIDVDSEASANHKHWVYYLSPPDLLVRSLPFLRELDDFVRAKYLTGGGRLVRAHVYSGGHADVYGVHEDTPNDDSLTVIYYPSEWEDGWGGELIFYSEDEPSSLVAIKRGRIILFNGRMRHRIASISSSACLNRQSVVLRYSIISPGH